ncbi:MAG TPA: ABC transporter substrate-binding protein [Stellaceae bacterium]|nr:ABC transporter substrate-binding protein [Stellaceae bacterium]
MRRRDFVAMLGGVAAALPVVARAQQSEPARRIGLLMNRAADSSDGQARLAAIRQRLQQLGWREGQNLLMEIRWGAEDPDLERKGAAELVALAPDVVLAGGSLGLVAMLGATRTIPVVFAGMADPVGLGVVASLAHPGGNATGFLAFEYSFTGKLLEVLKEIAPGVTRAAVLRDPLSPQGIANFAVIQSTAASMGVQVSPVDMRDPGEIERAVAALARSAGGGLVVTPSGLTMMHSGVILKLAAQYKLPAVYGYRDLVVGGGLISYGPDWLDQYRRAAEYVDRILRGEKPGDLPVQAPTKYELAVNLKTAKTLGLTVPDSILVRADEVIE